LSSRSRNREQHKEANGQGGGELREGSFPQIASKIIHDFGFLAPIRLA